MESSFRIGDWLVEPLHHRLVRGDTRVKLDPKVMQVLLYLAERPKEVALKEKIIETVWEGSFVTDEVLTNAIFELRKAFGDDAKEPRFIQTVHRKGYRLLAPVETAAGAPHLKKAWSAVIVVVVAAAAGFYFVRNEAPDLEIRTVPLTGFPGAEHWPALSPDGDRIAYVWDRGKPGPNKSLHVQMIGVGEPLSLTDGVLHEYSPVWSPDGKEIAFLRETELDASRESDVLVIPALGGPVRRLSTIRAVDIPGGGWNPGMAWSPDGRFLAVEDRETDTEPRGIFLLPIETGEKRRVTSPSNVRGDTQPAFSPDGKTIAFARLLGATRGQVFLQDLNAGEPKPLAEVEGWITDLDWVADGSAVFFVSASEKEAGTRLLRISASGGIPERLPFGDMAHTFSISRGGARLVHDRRSWFDSDIWRFDGPAAEERGSPTRLIASSRLDWAQEYSPDGTRVAFASERSGNNNIWVCESDGTGCRQLTNMERAAHPRWSPDGKRLVFNGRERGGGLRLYVVDVDGEFTRPITGTDSRNLVASWSHDGRWVYFVSDRTGEGQVWKMPSEGGEAIQITRKGGYNPRESQDGRFLYYVDANPSGTNFIRRVSVNGGEEVSISGAHATFPELWALWRDHIIFTNMGPEGFHVKILDVKTGEVNPIFSFVGNPPNGMTVSPDGRWILVSMSEPETSDIMLVEGFR